jgi:multidrug efflux pump subunit AcrB
MIELFSRKYLISFIYIIICIVGIGVWTRISIEDTPELNLPSITVSYNWGSTVPEIMEEEITRKVESAANRLRDVNSIRSVTQEGRSSVTIEFFRNAPVDFRTLELREYLSLLEDQFPAAVSQASVSRQVPEELEDRQTFIIYTLSGDSEGKYLLDYARQNIKNKLLGLEGLAEVNLEGVEDPALFVEFKKVEVERFGVDPASIMRQIQRQLNWRNAGFIEYGAQRYGLSIPPVLNNTTDISNLKIPIPESQKQLRLGDIAHIRVGDSPVISKRRINGKPSLSIEFIKESGSDAVSLAENIMLNMQEIEKSLPEGMDLRLQFDSTEKLREQFDELSTQAMLSCLFVFLVVWLFIRKLRAPLVILGSVIFSVLLSISLLYFFGYTLNTFTLAGITIALGILIDNAVVVFEQINRELPSCRKNRLKHIKKELPRSFVPVLGSTFTTIGIFLPLLFALEELRLFLLPLAIALSITLLCSVFIAITWIPYALVWLTQAESTKKEPFISGTASAGKLRRLFLRLMIQRYRFRWLLVFILFFTIGMPVFLIQDPDWEDTSWPEFTRAYFDNRDDIEPWIGGLSYRFAKNTYFGSPWRGRNQEYITVYIRSPQGTPLSEIDKIVQNYETIVKPYEEAFTFYEARMSEYFGAYLRFEVDPDYLFDPAPYYFFGEAMYLGARTGNVATSVSGFGDGISTGFGGQSSSHRITLTGYSYDELVRLATDIKKRLERNRRVRDVDINATSFFSRGDLQQYILDLNKPDIVARGLTEAEVLAAISLDVNPVNVFSRVEFQEQEMQLIGRTMSERAYDEDLLRAFRSIDSTGFSLSDFAEIRKEKALSEIRRNNQSYERVISLNFLGNYRMGTEYIEKVIDETIVPVGASIRFGNNFFSSNRSEERKNLWFIAMLSVFSVWMIVSALLESWRGPLYVILAIPFCALGIMSGTLLNDLPFDRGAIAGALLSIGIVVNNAILLFHQKQLENKAGIYDLRCWYNVYRKKVRTILITTISTVAGLMPMFLFGNNDIWQPLAIVVIWALVFSTLLILLLSGLWESKLKT